MADQDNQDWVKAYLELVEIIKEKVPEVRWQDLWMEQTSQEGVEYPFATPAVFYQFDTNDIVNKGENEQDLHVYVTVLLALDTVADSHDGSLNQEHALRFGGIMRQIHKAFHGRAGVHFSKLTRVAIRKEVAPPYVQLYSQTYATVITDMGATPVYLPHEMTADQHQAEKGKAPLPAGPPFFEVPFP